jgi:asparagine synthase (glutamine-hydrolysing)
MPLQWHEWIEQMDSPSIDGFNTYVVSRRLAQEDVVVGLSGLGADELFGGYHVFSRAPKLSRIISAMQLIPSDLRAYLATWLGPLSNPTDATEKLADVLRSNGSLPSVALALRRTFSNERLNALGILSTRTSLMPGYIDHRDDRHIASEKDAFNTVSRLEATHYMGDTLLRDTDANSMRQSLEVRVPFLDLPLVDYVSSLPGCVKSGANASSKSLLRVACRKAIRDDISKRPKTGFTLPIGEWMKHDMRESCEAAIERLESAAVLEGAEVRRIWNSFLRDDGEFHWSRPLSLVVLGSAIG